MSRARPIGDGRLLTLPNGLEVAYQSKAELQHFYDDIFDKRLYTRGGICLRDGDCVFDVGANIGMFTLFVAHHHPGARIFSFEPAPPVFELLRANTERMGGRVRRFNCGLAARPGTADLTFYPHSSGMSSFYPDEAQEKAALRTLIRGELARRAEVEQVLRYEEELVEQRFRSEVWTCGLRTLSDIVREHGVDRIDLLKIDVEKSEMDVLAGLADEDWPKVAQIVAEVHDMGDRLRELPELLRSRGFEVELEQDELYRGSDRWSLRAVRPRRASVTVAAPEEKPAEGIAVVGMAGRFPGAADLDAFWRNLCNGVESITFFSREELEAAGVDRALLDDSRYVPARGVIEGVELFDAAFFGFNPREAEIMDPQHRLFLECAWEALEGAGYDAHSYAGTIGIFGGMSMTHYLVSHLLAHPEVLAAAGPLQTRIYNDKDFLASMAAFKLGLTGPSITVQTACSTSLVAVCLACQSLLAYQCDMVLAGGVCVTLPQKAGYLALESVTSPDGHCRAFDAAAQGTVGGDGVGLVVLKRLADALADGDTIHAVIKGFATNNDGSLKLGYTTPGAEGQMEVVAMAQAVAGIAPESVGYVEAHGTGTPLGDPVEVAALAEVFGAGHAGSCALGSVKTNIGHLDAAAGVASLIKAALAVERGVLPPSLHFERPNPGIDFASTPFYVNAELRSWRPGVPRRAGVSSFAIGGVNAHLVVEEPPAPAAEDPGPPWLLLPLSARTGEALDAATERLVRHLAEDRPDLSLADAAWTLQAGRRTFGHRRVLVCRDRDDAVACLRGGDPRRLLGNAGEEMRDLPVAFLLSGLGNQHVGMAADLYRHLPRFREVLDACAEGLHPHLGLDLREVLFVDGGQGAGREGLDLRALLGRAPGPSGGSRLDRTEISQPAVFAVEYALARLLMDLGVRPQALLGFSVGELVAACIAGVLSLPDALRLVAERARLIGQLPAGAMLAVPLSEGELRPFLAGGLSLAAVAGPELCVLAGPEPAIARVEQRLAGEGRVCRRLQTSHAFHSAMMEPAADRLAALAAGLDLRPPEIPYISNVTGTWITAAEATDPTYWARHLCGTVRFAEGLAELWREPGRLLVEAGPGQALSSWAVQHPQAPSDALAVPLMRHELDRQSDLAFLLTALGRLWLAGVRLDWAPLWDGQRRRRVALPTYPFERRRHWLEAGPRRAAGPAAGTTRREDVSDWFWMPVWTQAPPLPQPAARPEECRWLLVVDEDGLGQRLAARLRHAGAEVGLVRDGEPLPDLAGPGLPWTVVHLACANEKDDVRELERPFSSLLSVVQALGRVAAPAHLLVVTRGLWRITGAEELRPPRAMVLGPALVAPLEQPDLSARVVDVDSPAPGSVAEEELLQDLMAEALVRGAERLSALRGGRRWLRGFEPVHLAAAPALLQEGDVWLVTGGLGGVGLALAHRLAESARARLVLLGRQPLAEEGDEELAARRGMLRSIRNLGCEVLELAADVTDKGALARAVSAARERFGRIDGVIHAAGVLPGGLLQSKTPEEAWAVLAPKVAGTLVLEEALRDAPPKVLILCSSLSALGGAFGLSDHVAANAFLDAFACLQEARNGRGGPWTLSVGWDAWLDVGQTARMARQLGLAPESGHAGTGGEPIAHPLLAWRRAEGPGREVFFGELATTSWVLDDHRVLGDGLLPGTAFLEMIRAACSTRMNGGATVVRRLGFARPLRVRDGERLSVRVIVSGNGAGLDVAVESRSGQAWELHARARVEPWAGPAERRHDPRAVRERCPRRAPVDRAAAEGIRFGPRWRGLLRELSLGDGEGLALLELDERYGADLEGMPLHPALLDAATGFVQAVGEGGYLPLEYEEVRIRAPLPRRFYSHFQHLRGGDGGTLTCDLALFTEGGEELLGIRGYTLRRVGPAGLAGSPEEPRPRPAAALHAAYAEGMTPQQGAEALLRLLSGATRVPHLAVSVSDLPARLRAAADMTARRVLDAAKEMRARANVHPRPRLHVPYEGPRNADEEELATVWQRVLRLDQVGVHDSFFDLGGDSLLATQLISSINEAFGVELTLRSVFEAPTVAKLARETTRRRSGPEAGGRDRLPPIVRRPQPGARPLSFAQRRLWLFEQLSPGTPSYNVPSAVSLEGRLDVPALTRALDEIVRRHDSLRTRFPSLGGEPLQEIAGFAPSPLPVLDLSVLPDEVRGGERDRLIRREAAAVFDLANGPLERRSLIRLRETEHVLLLTLHHLVADRLSHDILVAELSALYRAFAAGEPSPLPELEVQYADFGEWQRDLLEKGAWAAQMDHWRRALAGAPRFLELRLFRPRPPAPSFNAERRPVAVERESMEALVRLGNGERATLFMTLLAAFQVLLFHHSGEEDLVVGTSTSGRIRQETEGIIGFFANTLALRGDLSGDPDFPGILARVREATLGAFANQDLPFETVLEELRVERDPGRQPLFQTMFLLQEAAAAGAAHLPGLQVRFLDADPGTVKFDLTAFIFQGADGISGWLLFSSDLFEATAMDRMTRDFHHLLRLVAEQPFQPLSALCAALAQEDRGRRRQERDSTRSRQLQLLTTLSRGAADPGQESPL